MLPDSKLEEAINSAKKEAEETHANYTMHAREENFIDYAMREGGIMKRDTPWPSHPRIENNNPSLGDFTTQPRPEPLWVNPWTSKAQHIRITPDHTPFPEKKNPRRNQPRAVKKDYTFNYKEGC